MFGTNNVIAMQQLEECGAFKAKPSKVSSDIEHALRVKETNMRWFYATAKKNGLDDATALDYSKHPDKYEVKDGVITKKELSDGIRDIDPHSAEYREKKASMEKAINNPDTSSADSLVMIFSTVFAVIVLIFLLLALGI